MGIAEPAHAQADLFAIPTAEACVDESFSNSHRVVLDTHSWIEIVPGWLAGSQALFEHLRTTVTWQQHDRRLFEQTFQEPRLSGEFRTLDEVSDETLRRCVRALSVHYQVAYDSIWLNFYRNGNDSTGFHRDRPACHAPGCIVPVLTLGAQRRFVIKSREGGASRAFRPRSGDLIVMGGRCQQDWLHGVPKEPLLVEPRISLNFQSSSQRR